MAYRCISAMALAGFCVSLAAQTLFRCGNEYRDTPCPNARTLDARDPRTAAQRAQAEQLTAKQSALAAQLEKSRLQSEALVAKRLQARNRWEAAQQQKLEADAKAVERARLVQEAVVLKPHKDLKQDVFTVRGPKPPKNPASAVPR